MSQSDFVNRGQALVSSGQYQEAVKVCRLGLLGRPTTVEGRVVLGQALLALKRYDEVLAEMRVALELDHSAVPAYALKGEALLRKGDRHAAIEALEKAKDLAPADPQIIQLLIEAERVPGQASTVHPAVDYVRQPGGTRNYPNRSPSEEETSAASGTSGDDDDEAEFTEDEDSYTRPTSMAPPKALPPRNRPPDGTPPRAVLEIGDRSGTVEVDPDLEAVEVDDLVKPPQGRAAAQDFEGPRGKVQRSRKDKPTQSQRPKGPGSGAGPIVEKAAPMARKPRANEPAARDSAEELDSADIIAEDMAAAPPRSSPSSVRSAVNVPPGPFRTMAAQNPPPQPPQASLAQAIASAPHAIQMTPLPPQMAGQHMAAPGPATNSHGVPTASPQMKTMALSPTQQSSAVDGLFSDPLQPPPQPQQNWNRTVAPGGAPPPPPQPQGPPPQMYAAGPLDSGVAVAVGQGTVDERPRTGGGGAKTGMRKTRSKLAVVMWILIGGAVIGGGVFAGFQIRAMRLDKQIDAARERAVEQAQPDTFKGWADSRDSLAGIAQASSSPENRAALARTRALIAYEFADGAGDARAAVDQLKGTTGVDIEVARAYVALASDDTKGAKAAAEAAVADAADDAGAQYVQGLVLVENGDYPAGLAALKGACDKDGRALCWVGLARAHADVGAWDEALAALDKALKATPDHPSALILRAKVLVQSGRITPATATGAEVRTSLEKIITEAGKAFPDQPRGVSPLHLGFATLALIRLEYARNNTGAEQQVFRTLRQVATSGAEQEQRFAEETVDTLNAVTDYDLATAAAKSAFEIWPTSRRLRIGQAETLLAEGKPADALAALAKTGDATSLPRGLVVRAEAKLANGDAESARSDYELALKRMPSYERAIIGLASLDLAANDVDSARKLIEPRVTATASPALAAVYAGVLRATGDPAARDKARVLLEKVTKGPPTADLARAQLELARIYRDSGDVHEARNRYAEAIKAGNADAKLENAVLLVDEDPSGGRDSLDQLLKEAGASPPGQLYVEVARARMLVGDHDGANAALDAAGKATGTPKWELDRERARIAFRRGDIAGAAQAIDRALDGCGTDQDTFWLAADIDGTDLAGADPPKTPVKLAALDDKLRKLAGQRLKGLAEYQIVVGILALAAGKDDDATAAYETADKLAKSPVAPRLTARINLGQAVIEYDKRNYPAAKIKLETVFTQDPSNYTAYLFGVESVRDTDPKKALDYARIVVKLNPASIYGWVFYGQLGSQLQQPKLLAEAIDKVNALAPGSQQLKDLIALKK